MGSTLLKFACSFLYSNATHIPPAMQFVKAKIHLNSIINRSVGFWVVIFRPIYSHIEKSSVLLLGTFSRLLYKVSAAYLDLLML